MRKSSKGNPAIVHPDQLSLFSTAEPSVAMAFPGSSGDTTGTSSDSLAEIGSSAPTQAHPQSGPSATSGVYDGLPEGQPALRGADPGSFSRPTSTISVQHPSPSAHILNRSLSNQGQVPCAPPDPALSFGGDGDGPPEGLDSRTTKKKPAHVDETSPAPERGDAGTRALRQAGATGTSKAEQTVCIPLAIPAVSGASESVPGLRNLYGYRRTRRLGLPASPDRQG